MPGQGTLLTELPIVVKFKIREDATVKFSVSEDDKQTFKIDSAIIIAETGTYDGPYVVTPKAFDNQTLNTKNKVLSDDVQVLKVPKYETTNLSGGYTVYIAEE